MVTQDGKLTHCAGERHRLYVTYANARDVRNYLEKAISNQATRIVQLKNVDKETLAILEREDLEGISLG